MGRMSDRHIEEQENMTEDEALQKEFEQSFFPLEVPEETEDAS